MKNIFQIEKLKLLNDDDIYKVFNSMISNLYKEYSYVGFDIDEFNNILINGIRVFIDNYNNEEISLDVIINYLNKIINKKINKKLNNKEYDFIVNYFNNNIKYDNDFNNCLDELNKIGIYFLRLDYFPSMEIINEILDKCKDVVLIVENIFMHKTEEIIKGNISDVIDNINSISFIEIYCLRKHIEIRCNDTDDINIDDNISLDVRNTLKMYINEIPKYVYTYEEEIRMFRRFKTGDLSAREDLIVHNLRLVLKVAYKYVNSGLELEELIQEGNVGLIQAIDRYDYEKGYKFSTYALWWIRQSINRFIALKGRSIKLPIKVYDVVTKYNRYIWLYQIKYSRKPTYEELSLLLGLSIERVKEIESYSQYPSSLNIIINDKNKELGELIDNDEESLENIVFNEDSEKRVIDFIDSIDLKEKERYIIMQRIGLIDGKCHSLADIAKKINLTRERVRQYETRAIRRIIMSANGKKIVEFSDNPDYILKVLYELRKKYSESNVKFKKFYIEEKKEINNEYSCDGKKLFEFMQINSEERKVFIKEEISKLDERKQALIYRMYGTSLEEVNDDNLNGVEKRLLISIINTLRKQLAKKIQMELSEENLNNNTFSSAIKRRNIKSLYELLSIKSDEGKELINKIIDNLSYDDRDLVYAYFGESFGKPELVRDLTNNERIILKTDIIENIKKSFYSLNVDTKSNSTLYDKLEITKEHRESKKI